VLPVSAPEAASGQPNKRTLDPAQNIENKGQDIFLPPRSMVLKVVRGKILETLELSRDSTAFVFTRIDRLAKDCQLSKIVDYLVDNRCLCMLSQVEGQIKGKTDGTIDPVPIWECRS
jgi:hypothetical protein